MQRGLIITGVLILIIGLAWPWLSKLPFGRLPGDLSFERDNLKIYVPVTTMILASVILSLVLWFFRR